MAVKTTEGPFRIWGPRRSTAAHSHGRRCESLAAHWLKARGYRIEVRNLVTPAGEVDLLASREGGLFVVEVKGRRRKGWSPVRSLSRDKRRRLWRAAAVLHGQLGVPVRVLWVEVVGAVPWRLGVLGPWVGRWPERFGLRVESWRVDPP